MDQELASSVEPLERRLALMRELADSLEQVQTAVVGSDLAGIDRQTARQRSLCESLRHLESEAVELPQRRIRREHLAEAAVPPELQRSKTLAEELAQVEMRVNQLNLVYGALLRRARRTLQIFMRVLASSAGTYAPPKCPTALAPPARQEASHV